MFYPGDWLTGCIFLSMEQRGVYITLLCLQFEHGPLNYNQIRSVCSDEMFNSIESKFEKNSEGLYFNARLAEEQEKRRNYSESRRKNRQKKDMKNICKTYEKDMLNISESYEKHMENENENINEDINEDIKKGVVKGEKEFGNAEVNAIINHLKDKLPGGLLDGTVKANRNAAFRLIKKIKKGFPAADPVVNIKLLIDAGMNDNFHSKNLTSFTYLDKHFQKLVANGKQQQQKSGDKFDNWAADLQNSIRQNT